MEWSMTEEEILKRIQTIFIDEFELEPDQLTREATIFEDLELDSLDAVDMVVALEKEFGVKVKNEESLRSIRTLDDLLQLILAIRDQMNTSDQKIPS